MSTSGSTDFTETARQISTSALELIGAIPIGDEPAAEDANKAIELLNLMVKTWGADTDPKLWLMTEATVTLVASTASYSVPNARKIVSVRRRTSGIDLPLIAWSRQDYYDQPNKAATGFPVNYYFDPQRATRTLYVWPVPDATIAASTTLPYSYLRVIEDLDSLDDDFDVPQEWFEALLYGLAARLTIPYKTHISDPQGAAKIEQRAAALYAQLSSFDDEDTPMFLQPYQPF